MTRRSFVGAGVLFFVLLVPRPGHADPIIILDGLITKAGEFRGGIRSVLRHRRLQLHRLHHSVREFRPDTMLDPLFTRIDASTRWCCQRLRCYWNGHHGDRELQLRWPRFGKRIDASGLSGDSSRPAGRRIPRTRVRAVLSHRSMGFPVHPGPTTQAAARFERLRHSHRLPRPVIHTGGVAFNKSGVSLWQRPGARPGTCHSAVDGDWARRAGAPAVRPPTRAQIVSS